MLKIKFFQSIFFEHQPTAEDVAGGAGSDAGETPAAAIADAPKEPAAAPAEAEAEAESDDDSEDFALLGLHLHSTNYHLLKHTLSPQHPAKKNNSIIIW